MATFTVISEAGCGARSGSYIRFPEAGNPGIFHVADPMFDEGTPLYVNKNDLLAVELMSELQEKSKLGGAALGAGLGFLIAGPLGTAVGGLMGSSRKDTNAQGVFVFTDERYVVVDLPVQDLPRFLALSAEIKGNAPLLEQSEVKSDHNSQADQDDGHSPPSGEIKECPDCAEIIRFKAKVCRFCGYRYPDGEVEQAIMDRENQAADAAAAEVKSAEVQVARQGFVDSELKPNLNIVADYSGYGTEITKTLLAPNFLHRQAMKADIGRFFSLSWDWVDSNFSQPTPLHYTFWYLNYSKKQELFHYDDIDVLCKAESASLTVEAWNTMADLSGDTLEITRQGSINKKADQATFMWFAAGTLGPFWCQENKPLLYDFVTLPDQYTIKIGKRARLDWDLNIDSVAEIATFHLLTFANFFFKHKGLSVRVDSSRDLPAVEPPDYPDFIVDWNIDSGF